MTDREQTIADTAHRYALQFLEAEDDAGMIKGGRLRDRQMKRMRRYVNHQLANEGKFGSIELWVFAIFQLGKILYAAWKVWHDRHAVDSTGGA